MADSLMVAFDDPHFSAVDFVNKLFPNGAHLQKMKAAEALLKYSKIYFLARGLSGARGTDSVL